MLHRFLLAAFSALMARPGWASRLAQQRIGPGHHVTTRRLFNHASAGLLLSPFPLLATAQASPAAPTRVLVGFPPDGPVDIAARWVCSLLSERLDETFVVENAPGHSGNDATAQVALAPADGRTLLMCGPVNTINTTLFPGLPFDFGRDFAAVALVYGVPLIAEVHPSVPAASSAEFIALAKRRPGMLRVGYAGEGTPQHIALELFRSMAGVDVTLVAYAGSAPALTDLLAGRIDAMFDPAPSSIEHVRAGRLRPLATTGRSRLSALPDVPLMSEVVPGYEAGSWFGLCAPRTTPAARITALNAATNAALSEPSAARRVSSLGGIAMPGTPAEFENFIAAETAKYAKVIADAGIPLREGYLGPF